MTQKTVLGVNEQIIAQAELEKDIKKQADLIAPEKDLTHKQIQSFLSLENLNVTTPISTNIPDEPHREPLKHLLIGSPKTVTSTIYYLKKLGYADVNDWSPLLPSPTNSGEVMTILVKYIVVQ